MSGLAFTLALVVALPAIAALCHPPMAALGAGLKEMAMAYGWPILTEPDAGKGDLLFAAAIIVAGYFMRTPHG